MIYPSANRTDPPVQPRRLKLPTYFLDQAADGLLGHSEAMLPVRGEASILVRCLAASAKLLDAMICLSLRVDSLLPAFEVNDKGKCVVVIQRTSLDSKL